MFEKQFQFDSVCVCVCSVFCNFVNAPNKQGETLNFETPFFFCSSIFPKKHACFLEEEKNIIWDPSKSYHKVDCTGRLVITSFQTTVLVEFPKKEDE